MVHFPSDLSKSELIEQWDEHTSPARFAGSDDSMDLIFISKRVGNRIRLVRRARTVREPFATVFRGNIVESESGSAINGIFTKSIFDYLLIGGVIALLFYIRYIIIERGESLNAINALLVIAVVAGMLLLMNFRGSKRKYSDFISRITGIETDNFLKKSEQKEREENQIS